MGEEDWDYQEAQEGFDIFVDELREDLTRALGRDPADHLDFEEIIEGVKLLASERDTARRLAERFRDIAATGDLLPWEISGSIVEGG